ncbi:MAG: hypothetical protein EOO28_21460 [Comamonadaceae bacterium]|nr:MAG: hypothetical protein EOO28_21460 [Comamonadaceae bacterium]
MQVSGIASFGGGARPAAPEHDRQGPVNRDGVRTRAGSTGDIRGLHGHGVAHDASTSPRLPELVARDRAMTAARFLAAAESAKGLSTGGLVTSPAGFTGATSAIIQAVTASDDHNRHCRAGTPIGEDVQAARRSLAEAVDRLLGSDACDAASRGLLRSARGRLASLALDPNNDARPGLRSLIYGHASQWLTPHDVQALAAASVVPQMPMEDFHRSQLASARLSLQSLKDALEAACDAHVDAPSDAVLKSRYEDCLKQAYTAMELNFHDAMKGYQTANAAFQAATKGAVPVSYAQRMPLARAVSIKKDVLLAAAADLQTVAGLRLSGLKAFCDSIRPPAGQQSARHDEACEQLAQTRTLLASCVYAGSL